MKTLAELAATVHLVEEKPPKPRGLFWDLLGGDIQSLAADILENPANYDERLVVLTRELAEGRKKVEELTPEEQGLMNRGTVDFAQFRPSPIKQKAPPPPRKTRPSDETRVKEPPPIPDPQVDVPETSGGMRPYWWI